MGVAIANLESELADGHFGVAFQEFFGGIDSDFAKDFGEAGFVFLLKVMG